MTLDVQTTGAAPPSALSLDEAILADLAGMRFGERLRFALEAVQGKPDVKAWAEGAGMPYRSVQDHVGGLCLPNIPALLTYKRATGFSLDWLIAGDTAELPAEQRTRLIRCAALARSGFTREVMTRAMARWGGEASVRPSSPEAEHPG